MGINQASVPLAIYLWCACLQTSFDQGFAEERHSTKRVSAYMRVCECVFACVLVLEEDVGRIGALGASNALPGERFSREY